MTERVAAESTAGFEAERARLLALAYRMLGSVSDAEDVLQDAWLRLRGSGESPQSLPAWLTTTVSRLAIDQLRRRQSREYPGPWLPEPLLTEEPDLVEQIQDVTLGVLYMLERLTPEERTTFVLREALGDDFRTISEVLDAREDTCRQYYRRARTRLGGSARFDAPDPARQRAVAEAMLHAIHDADRTALLDVLREDAVAIHDGGGVMSAAIRPIETADRIAQVYLHISGRMAAREGDAFEMRPVVMPGEIAMLTLVGGALDSVSTLELIGDRIARLFLVRNPGKLQHFARALGVPLANPAG